MSTKTATNILATEMRIHETQKVANSYVNKLVIAKMWQHCLKLNNL